MIKSDEFASEYFGKPDNEKSGKPFFLKEWGWVLAAYFLFAAILTFPLVTQLSTHMIGLSGDGITSDSFQNLWYTWWYGRALELGQDPSQTHLMYGLLPSVQVLVSSVINGLIGWPLRGLFGPLLAYNFCIFISFPLAGFFMFQLAGEFTRRQIARFIAGLCFAFCTYHLARAQGHIGLVTVQWLPFYAWRLFAFRRAPTLSSALLVGLGFVLAALSDLYYLGYFVLPFTFLFIVWFGWFDRKHGFWEKGRPARLALGLGLGILAIIPFYSFFLKLETDVGDSVEVRAKDVTDFSANLLSFFLPNLQNPFLGNITAPLYANFAGIFPIEQAVYPGIVLLLAGFSAPFLRTRRNRETFFWLVAGLASLIMALGQKLHIGSTEIGLPLPYTLYTKLPFLNTYRAPNRFAIVLVMALAVLAALTLARVFHLLSQKFPGKKAGWINGTLAVIIVVVALGESSVYQWPLPTGEVRTPAIYQQIAAEAGDFLVLELPLAPLSAPLYYQIEHQKPLVGGYPSRISNKMSLSFDQTPYLSMFNPAESSAVMDGSVASSGHPEIFPLDVSFKQTLQARNIRYVLLHSYPSGRRFFKWMRPYLEGQLGNPTWKENDSEGSDPLLVWKIEAGTAFPKVATGQVRLGIGEGWNAGLGKGEDGKLQRLVIQDGKLLVEVANAGSANLSLRFTPVIRPQTLEVRLNGQVIGRVEGKKEWVNLPASFPNLSLKAGVNVLELHSVEGCLVANQYIPNSPDTRCISLAVQDVRIELQK